MASEVFGLDLMDLSHGGSEQEGPRSLKVWWPISDLPAGWYRVFPVPEQWQQLRWGSIFVAPPSMPGSQVL